MTGSARKLTRWFIRMMSSKWRTSWRPVTAYRHQKQNMQGVRMKYLTCSCQLLHPSICPFIYPSGCPSIHPSIRVSTVRLSIQLSMYWTLHARPIRCIAMLLACSFTRCNKSRFLFMRQLSWSVLSASSIVSLPSCPRDSTKAKEMRCLFISSNSDWKHGKTNRLLFRSWPQIMILSSLQGLALKNCLEAWLDNHDIDRRNCQPHDLAWGRGDCQPSRALEGDVVIELLSHVTCIIRFELLGVVYVEAVDHMIRNANRRDQAYHQVNEPCSSITSYYDCGSKLDERVGMTWLSETPFIDQSVHPFMHLSVQLSSTHQSSIYYSPMSLFSCMRTHSAVGVSLTSLFLQVRLVWLLAVIAPSSVTWDVAPMWTTT